MSRERVLRAAKDLYSRHSQRILRARQHGEIDFYGYAILSYFIDVIDLPGRDQEAALTLEGLAAPEALEWPLSPESLRQKLHELRRQGWIDFDVRERQRKPWIFRLTGAAIDAEMVPISEGLPSLCQPEDPSHLAVGDNGLQSGGTATPLPDVVPEVPQLATVGTLEQSRAEKSGETTVFEEELDQVGNTTTPGPLQATERMLATLREIKSEKIERPLIGDGMYPLMLAEAGNAGHITQQEFDELNALHKLVECSRVEGAAA